ncbi:hypothetical protein QQM79_19260 [Marinobacteraceae bacterium S3BR75-40.1]
MNNKERILGIALGLTAAYAHADLKPISDQAMGNITGQAMFAYDVRENAEGDFTRITMGMDAEVQTNVQTVALGELADSAEPTGADLLVDHLSLGHISTDDTKVQLDGQTYAINDIVPFIGKDPYFEIAEDADGGDIVGFRVGFGEARGTLSGDISSFSGNIGMKFDDGSGTLQDAQLMNADGTADNYRATHIGVVGAGTDCSTNTNCTALNNIKTWDVGVDNGDGTVGFTDGFFLSFQKQAVTWETNATTGSSVTANPGVFMNMPTSMTLDASQLQNGIPRARTEYIDRGQGLF